MIVKVNGLEIEQIEKINNCMEKIGAKDQITEIACQGWAMEHDFIDNLLDFISNLF